MVNVLLFPGQGAQKVGMGKDLVERYPAARSAFLSIDAALGFSLTSVMWNGPEDELQKTVNTQPAILAHSAAVLAVLGTRIGPIAGAAGHSLGEYSAYLAAGSLSVESAAKLVRCRGELMHEAGSGRPGAMAVVLGLGSDLVATACREATAAGAGVAVAANFNAPDQTVISGDPDSVARAGERCKALGAKRLLPLKVSGAFHSPLMAPAEAGLRHAIVSTPFADPAFPVVANVTAHPVTTAKEATTLLVDQLTRPVRWVECAQALAQLAPGARFLEIGPGTVLGGLLKRSVPDAQYLSLGTADEIARFLG
jgi:[acyl-carrier-protein] S-malonyltransferase